MNGNNKANPGRPDSQVLQFRRSRDADELQRLRRLTGLVFESVPQSLLRDGSAWLEGEVKPLQAGTR